MANLKGNPDVPAFKESQGRLKGNDTEASRLGKIGGRITSERRKKRKSIAEALEIMQEINKEKLVDEAIKKKKPELAEVIDQIGWLPHQLQGIINNPIPAASPKKLNKNPANPFMMEWQATAKSMVGNVTQFGIFNRLISSITEMPIATKSNIISSWFIRL